MGTGRAGDAEGTKVTSGASVGWGLVTRVLGVERGGRGRKGKGRTDGVVV